MYSFSPHLLHYLLTAAFGAYALYRLTMHWRRGKAFPRVSNDQILYEEYGASGNSQDDIFLRFFGKANHCLKVTVTQNELLIRPIFPFSLLGFLLDAEHYVPKHRIVSAIKQEGLFRDGLLIRYKEEDNKERAFLVHPENFDKFSQAMNREPLREPLGAR